MKQNESCPHLSHPCWTFIQEERLKVVFSGTFLPPLASGLLVQISSLRIGNLLVNESSLVVNHLKLTIALACRA